MQSVIMAIRAVQVIWMSGVNRSPENARLIVDALQEFGFSVPELNSGLFQQAHRIVRMGVVPFRIELLTTISGVVFDECYPVRVIDVLDGIEVDLISLFDLKVNKRASGRLKDWTDLEHLP